MKKQGEIMRTWIMMMVTGLLILFEGIDIYPYSVKTHRELSRRAVLASQLDDFLRDQLDISGGVENRIARIGSPLGCVGAIAVTPASSVVIETEKSVSLVLPVGVPFVRIMKQGLGRER
jgi:hypothetical protein